MQILDTCPPLRKQERRLSSVQFSPSVVSDSLRPHGRQHTRPSCPSTTPRAYTQTYVLELVLPSNHLILCHPLLFLTSIFPSTRVISNESVLRIRWPKYWSFSFSISPSNEHPGLISIRLTGWISLQSKGLSRVFFTVQFKSINSLMLSFLYSPTLTSIHDYWKNHSLD